MNQFRQPSLYVVPYVPGTVDSCYSYSTGTGTNIAAYYYVERANTSHEVNSTTTYEY
jgi:hypothetical protein